MGFSIDTEQFLKTASVENLSIATDNIIEWLVEREDNEDIREMLEEKGITLAASICRRDE